MAKFQNKLFAKLAVVEEKGDIILGDLKLCQKHLATIVSQCRGLLQASVSNPDQFILGLGKTLDHVSNMLVLTIARVGNLPQPEIVQGANDNDDLMTMEMKNKLREILTNAHTLQTFCKLTMEETQKRIDSASRILVDPPHNLQVLSSSVSETLLTEVSGRVLKVLNNLEKINNSHPELRARNDEIYASVVLKPVEKTATNT